MYVVVAITTLAYTAVEGNIYNVFLSRRQKGEYPPSVIILRQ